MPEIKLDAEATSTNQQQRTGNSVIRRWAATATIALTTFSVVTAEMMPIGIATNIADSFSVSIGTVGLAVTLPSLVAAISSILVVVFTGKLDRKTILVGLAIVLAAANLLGAAAPSYWLLLISRLFIGVAIGGVWAIAVTLGPRLVPTSAARATALIFSGIAVASVIGIPTGAWLAGLGGWRLPFLVLGILAVLLAIALAVLMPRVAATTSISPRALPQVFTVPGFIPVLIISGALFLGQFSAYTFVRPLLQSISLVPEPNIAMMLAVYGVAGVLGNFLVGHLIDRRTLRVLGVVGLALILTVLVVLLPRESIWLSAVLLAFWGLAWGGVSVGTQVLNMRVAQRSVELASAVFVFIVNLAISVGSLLGGLLVDHFGLPSVIVSATALFTLATITTVGLARRRPEFR